MWLTVWLSMFLQSKKIEGFLQVNFFDICSIVGWLGKAFNAFATNSVRVDFPIRLSWMVISIYFLFRSCIHTCFWSEILHLWWLIILLMLFDCFFCFQESMITGFTRTFDVILIDSMTLVVKFFTVNLQILVSGTTVCTNLETSILGEKITSIFFRVSSSSIYLSIVI